MAHISLVLPFALPAPEFAPDLVRALKAPGLAGLLSKTSSARFVPLEAGARVLPHELAVARMLGLARGLTPALANEAMRGCGIDPAGGTWYLVNPAHFQIAPSHLMMGDVRQLDLREIEARALFDSARDVFTEAGHDLRYGAPDTWFMRADGWDGMVTSSPDAAVGMNLTDWMPSGPPARAFRKLQNDVQVTWYTHPANAAREARGQVPVNAFWPWGGADQQAGAPGARPRVATYDVPGWLAALGDGRHDSLAAMARMATGAEPGSQLLLVCGNAAAPAIAADWHGWLQQMQLLEEHVFTPLLAALAAGRIKALRLLLSHRDGHLDTTTTPMAQRKFWRRPTLEALL